jgi:hypothetical protein
MEIHLKEADLKAAVADFVLKMGIVRPVDNVEFTATRGSEGVLTTVILDTLVESPPIPVEAPVQLQSVPELSSQTEEDFDDLATSLDSEEAVFDEELDATAKSLFSS